MIELLKENKVLILFLVINILMAGIGMGVPIFNIIFGFLVGASLGRKTKGDARKRIKELFKKGGLVCLSTLLMMLVIWLPALKWLVDPALDVRNFGHPFFLYDPQISFIGWIVLMVFISPLLQLLAIIFSGVLNIIYSKEQI